jgi:hypothetical protein
MTCIMRSSKQIQASNAQYKLQADSHRRHTAFSIGDYVIVRIRPERFHLDLFENCKLIVLGFSKCCSGSDQMHYVIDIPPDHGISSTFNVEDLVAYTIHTIIPDDPFEEPPLSPIPILNLIPYNHFFHQHIKKISMLFWMSRLFLLGMEEFSVS